MKLYLIKALLAFAIAILLIAGQQPLLIPTNPASPTKTTAQAAKPQSSDIDLTRLPIGDGKISTAPMSGSVWACRRASHDGIGGAQVKGAWIKTDGTFDFTTKAVVDGKNRLPHNFTFVLNRNQRLLTGNDLPKRPVGTFPISPSDDAYQSDRNPNRITAQNLQIQLPAIPSVASQPSCLPPRAIGVLLTGGYFFNALDAADRDAVAHEAQDHCQGHPEITGAYHYHSLTTCFPDNGKGHSSLVGYALDGFGIYGHRGQHGKVLTNAALDQCHGHTHPLNWDGKTISLYHYHASWEYPYTVGCYRGTPTRVAKNPT